MSLLLLNTQAFTAVCPTIDTTLVDWKRDLPLRRATCISGGMAPTTIPTLPDNAVIYVAKTHDRPAERTPLNGRRRFDGRSPGSRVNAKRPAFPVLTSGIDGALLAAYSCGGSYGMGPKAAPYSHLIPRETVLAKYSRRVAKKPRLKKLGS